jgi:hypothetical protein
VKHVAYFCGPLTFRVDSYGYITRVFLRGMDLGCPTVDFYLLMDEF